VVRLDKYFLEIGAIEARRIIQYYVFDLTVKHRLVTMSKYVPRICVEDAVLTATCRTCQAVESDNLSACQVVREYIADPNMPWPRIATLIIEALNSNFARFIRGISSNFSDLRMNHCRLGYVASNYLDNTSSKLLRVRRTKEYTQGLFKESVTRHMVYIGAHTEF
jgi:hypothetical protein